MCKHKKQTESERASKPTLNPAHLKDFRMKKLKRLGSSSSAIHFIYVYSWSASSKNFGTKNFGESMV